jgi:hypothetical protein
MRLQVFLDPLIGVYTLVPNLANVFLPSGENGPESVFEVQHVKNSNWWIGDSLRR